MVKWQGLMKSFEEKIEGVDRRVLSITSVFLWGLFAHLTGFTSALFSHDSLRELYTEGIIGYAGISTTEWKVALGRFFWPVYQSIFRLNGTTVLPFWNGILGLVWLSITAIIIVEMFNITKKAHIVLLGGILSCNLAVIATAGTYIGDFDTNLFGVMLATLAVNQWIRNDNKSWLAVLYLALAMGAYQSNISVFICLVIILTVIQLFDDKDTNSIIRNGIKAVIIVLLTGVLYFLLAFFATRVHEIELTSSQNGIAKMWANNRTGLKFYLSNLYTTYKQWTYDFLLLDKGLLSIMHSAMFVCLSIIGVRFLKSGISIKNKIVACVLIAILPLGMNLAGFLNGEAHLLMTYSFWLLYVLALLLPDQILRLDNKKYIVFVKNTMAVMVFIILMNNVKLANGVYLKKNIERQSTLSYMTRVVDFVESVEGFDVQKNEVLFIGNPKIQSSSAYSSVNFITGAGSSSSITNNDVFQVYFDYVLQYPIMTVKDENRKSILEKVDESELGVFPSPNSYAWVDSTLVIKLQ